MKKRQRKKHAEGADGSRRIRSRPTRSFVVGIDEVGRGALAGPAVVAAAMIAGGGKWRMANGHLGKLRDSKQLTARQREAWYAHFADHPDISFAVACVYPRQIEKLNISGAANLAALRAYQRLGANGTAPMANSLRKMRHGPLAIGHLPLVICPVPTFLDGGLYLGSRKGQRVRFPHALTKPKADENMVVVTIASIIAKVHRDRLMGGLAKKYPGYGLEVHKGYGTKRHYAALKKLGSSKAHRLTFLGKRTMIDE